MYLETRTLPGGEKKHYLTQSYRKGGKTRKIRVFLGSNLSSKELMGNVAAAEPKLRRRAEALAGLRDPLHTVLSTDEKKRLETLAAGIRGKIKVHHLSEGQWKRFSELFAYDTNAIEGSTVTESEVEGILEKNAWPRDRPKEEISETYGVAEAVEFIRKTREHLSLGLILQLHGIVFKNSKSFAGKLRAKGVEVAVTDGAGGIIHRGAPSTHVKKLLLELSKWYEENRKKYHPLVLAAIAHNQFENIHPLQDGNGRVGRLLLNNILIKHGLPPVNIELARRKEYYASLQAYQKQYDLRPTIELLLKEYAALQKALKKPKK